MVVLDAVERLGLDAAGHAGHSLGEYSALAAAGTLEFGDAVRLVAERGAAMNDAIENAPGTMAAILGLNDERVEAVCDQAGDGVWVANYNAPQQVVVAGRPTAVAKAAEVAQELGAKRIASLDVAGAFHTPLMSLARERLAGALDATDLRIPEGTVVANVDATAHQSPETWRALMTAQLCSPVRWAQTLLTLKDLGFTTFVELGPGAVLSGLAKRTVRGSIRLQVSTPADLDNLLDALAPNPSDQDGGTGSHEGEHLFATDRLVVSPTAGIFAPVRDLEPGTIVSAGFLLGWIGNEEVRSPFAGELMSWLALSEERVTASQPIAWLRVP
jgi:[acyl-carrier-protein] S-malonyltransferase